MQKINPIFSLDPDIKALHDRYCSIIANDENSLSIIELLPYAALHDPGKIKKVLMQLINENKQLFTVYPGLGDTATPDMTFVGDIYEGGLYIK